MARKRQLLIGGVVIVALGFVGLASYAPEQLPPIITAALDIIETSLPRRLLLVGVGGLLVLYSLRRRYVGSPHFRQGPLSPVDNGDESSYNRVGDDYTTAVSQATAAIADAQPPDDTTVVEPLRTAFINLLVARGWPRDQAAAYVETGRWTDDTTVAVFLGTDRAGDYPFWYRVYAWLLPERAFRHRVTAVVDHLLEYAAAAPGEMHQPPTVSQSRVDETSPAAEVPDSSLPPDSADPPSSEGANSSPPSDSASTTPTGQAQ